MANDKILQFILISISLITDDIHITVFCFFLLSPIDFFIFNIIIVILNNNNNIETIIEVTSSNNLKANGISTQNLPKISESSHKNQV